MRDQELIDLFEAATGSHDGASVTLDDGRKVSRLGLVGDLVIDGKAMAELELPERDELVRALQKAGAEAYLDPARNPFIRTSD